MRRWRTTSARERINSPSTSCRSRVLPTRPAGYGIVNHDYRMGTYEITNDQWNKFTASLGVPVTGSDGGYSHQFLLHGHERADR